MAETREKHPHSIWWYLAMEFHAQPTVGHSLGPARECWMCECIVRTVQRAGGDDDGR